MRYYANKIEIPLEQIAYLDMIMPRSIQSSGTNSQEYKPSNGHPTIIVKIRTRPRLLVFRILSWTKRAGLCGPYPTYFFDRIAFLKRFL